ncbi:MAG: dihydrolipoamide acetyltransferase family protein [Acidimicrobiales bacterium]
MPDITMPQLGETVTEGTIIRWMKKVGDEIACDEPLFEVSTDKVDSEVPSPAAGYLAEILVAEGATVDVGTKLAVVTDDVPSTGVRASSPAAPAATSPPLVPAPSEPAPAAIAARVPQVAPLSAQPEPGPAPSEEGESGADKSSNGPGLVLSPVVRQLVAEYGIDPATVPGTGKGGRITRADVLAFIDYRAAGGEAPVGEATAKARTEAVAGTQGSPAVTAAPRSYEPVAGARDEVVPFTNIRRITAEHMVRSKATSAHTLAVIEADYEGIERVRRAHKDRFREEEGIGLSYLAFIARALTDTLRDFPHLNASVGDDALVVHRDVHLGIAVDLGERGLIVPVVRHAEEQSLRGLARAIADLAERARIRKLSADEVAGGTFTITNPGPFGTFLTAPIINQPQVAILSTDGIKRRPVVVTSPDGTEAVGIHSVGLLALSFDHRAVDGAYASGFLHELARVIESRDWEAEL